MKGWNSARYHTLITIALRPARNADGLMWTPRLLASDGNYRQRNFLDPLSSFVFQRKFRIRVQTLLLNSGIRVSLVSATRQKRKELSSQSWRPSTSLRRHRAARLMCCQ